MPLAAPWWLRLVSTGLCVFGLAAGRAEAQVLARDSGARLERVGDGVYVILHADATDEWPHGNTGVVVGDDGVLVVDATYLPSRARADIALIRAITGRPVRYLVYTHWHFDHNNGAVAYKRAFPGITIVSERESAGFVVLNQIWWSKMSTAPGSTRRAGLDSLAARLGRGQDSTGKPLSPEARTQLEKAVRQRRGEQDELASLEVVPPGLLFEKQLRLWLGKRRIELEDRGHANSPHDVTVWLPDERILFTGDILVQSPLPYVGASWPLPWIDVLKDIEATPIVTMVPGHGPVVHDHTYTRQVRALLEAATSRVTDLARQGKTLQQVQAALDLEDLRRATPAWSADSLEAEWKEEIPVLIERAWRGVRGQGG
jgi:glyoxylase-like metal-dependent hydrolase (beta-lactamase superfamily II)